MIRDMQVTGIGVDAVEVQRFRALLQKKKDHFIDNTFSKEEQHYCYSYTDAASHFAGTFAAKEAARKAAGLINLPMRDIEVHRDRNGKPELWVTGKRLKNISISITHNTTLACAVAIKQI